MSDDAVLSEVTGSIARVSINRPLARNALRYADKVAVRDLIREFGQSQGISAIVITSTDSRAFCAGTDIAEMAEMSIEESLDMFRVEGEMYAAVLEAPVPIIAALRGAVMGAGCVLVCCADVAVASQSAVFGLPELALGVPAPMHAALLPQVVGLGRARHLLFTGATWDAEKALASGLVFEVVDDEMVLQRAESLARAAGDRPRSGASLQKQLLNSWIRGEFDSSVSLSPFLAASSFLSESPQRAMRDFLQARKPRGSTDRKNAPDAT